MTEKEIIESWAKTARPLLTICLIGFTQKNTEKENHFTTILSILDSMLNNLQRSECDIGYLQGKNSIGIFIFARIAQPLTSVI